MGEDAWVGRVERLGGSIARPRVKIEFLQRRWLEDTW